MEFELDVIDGKNPPYPKAAIESWRAAEEGEAAWEAATRRFTGLLAEIAQRAESDAAVLESKLQDPISPHSSRESTVHTVLRQIAAHNSYHAGQIALLRRQLGAWPPRRGGDTW
jgi:uncharacterized damage-inducible protein DinB